MNKLIGEFYAYMQKRLAIGCTFNDGLCLQLLVWASSTTTIGVIERGALLDRMKDQFKEAGLSAQYPFNKDGDEYRNEQRNGNLYSNHQRIKWIIDHASNY